MPNRLAGRALVLTLLAVAPALAAPQDLSAPAPAPSQPPRHGANTVTVGVAVMHDRYDYRFENPSSFDTATLVPHAFEQRDVANNTWLVIDARFRAGGRWWDTEVAVAPGGTGTGDDYDTFHQPDGDVVVYGTTAVTDLRSFEIRQRVELAAWHAWTVRGGYGFRRDRADYRPSDTTTTHTVPPSRTSFFNTDRERTISDVQGVEVGLGRTLAEGRRWLVSAALDTTPLTVARLTTQLPDKYPGRDIVFTARSLTLAPSLRASVARARTIVRVSLEYRHAIPYGSTRHFSCDMWSARVAVGWKTH
jgi:hypothetical protein